MRIAIRVQLGLLVLLTALAALAVLCIAIWVNNYTFVISVKSQGLSLAASLKAAQVASELELLQSTCGTIVSRILIQQAILRFYAGNSTDANWVDAIVDVQSALGSGGYSSLLQAVIYSRNGTGNNHGLLNVSGPAAQQVILPYSYPNGTAVRLGDIGPGYPPMLYPNVTYIPTAQVDPADSTTNKTVVYAFPDLPLNKTSNLLLGPLQINSSFAIVSITLPIINNTSDADIIGFMTVVASASRLYNVLTAREGLGDTGIALLLGPANTENRFSYGDQPVRASSSSANTTALELAKVAYVFKPTSTLGQDDRHDVYNHMTVSAFPLSVYPAAFTALSQPNSAINNASSDLSTTNEQGSSVAVGVARPQSTLVDWVLMIEQTHDEAWAPVTQLRNILLACVFGTAGLIAFIIIPLAHFSVLPIQRLKQATEKSVQPPGYTPTGSIRSQRLSEPVFISDEGVNELSTSQRSHQNNGILFRIQNLRRGRRRQSKAERTEDARRRVFKIPGKVQEKKHFVTDELTELTSTFNEMSDELMMQYAKLEERVAQRTRELEISMKAAEAANESKTLFIANISHELKTPLNGILGMCAVCMGEDDLSRIKRSLQVVYKSGDLLLHLLNDLLTFSKNQIGQALSLDEKEFSLSDIKSQIINIFDKQIRDGKINFSVTFVGIDGNELGPDRSSKKPLEKSMVAMGPVGTGRLKDMRLWGDQHRILQVIINLVSNSLKFTPEGGMVEVQIKCIGEAEPSLASGKVESLASKQGSQGRSKTRPVLLRIPSGTKASSKPGDTALLINPMDPTMAIASMQIQERSATPPPANARTLIFEFQVADTGPGIPLHLQQRIFEPFVQGDLGLSKKYGGTGLGLSICSQLSNLMSGTITLESTEGVGSTFNMQIPLRFVKEKASSMTSSSLSGSRPSSIMPPDGDAKATTIAINNSSAGGFETDSQPRLVGLSQPFFAAATLQASSMDPNDQVQALDRAATNENAPGKIRVLVAEDNLVNQEVVLRMLKLEGINDVTVAKDGQEAYDIVKSIQDEGQVYNLIFMDIQMPNLDGLQSTRLIREMGYSAPIVALSAFSDESNVKNCMESGMNMFLSKPIRRPALKHVLQKFGTIPEESEVAAI